MKIENIKPIPKYIVERIRKLDKLHYPAQNGNQRFYAYLTKNDKELCKVTVCVKNRYSKWHIKQCAVHGIDSDKCFVKDMVFRMIAGYQVGWYAEGLTRTKQWYEDDEWGWAEDRWFDMYAPIVNIEYLSKISEFKYSAYELYPYMNIIPYLRQYRKYPECEYLVKLGLHKYVSKKQIMDLLHKDKGFRKWIGRHKDKLKTNRYYASTIVRAYKKNLDLDALQYFETKRKEYIKTDCYKLTKELFNGKLESFFDYLKKQNTNYYSYADYIKACKELGIDLGQDKNLFPHDFRKWHDIRIDEYNTLLAERDKKARAEMYEKFLKVAKKYLTLQRNLKDDFVAIIAMSPQDLINEGDMLHHCVGRMNYDQKFIREETLIFFIRSKKTPDVPLVTIEYSLSKKKVLQCYGDHDSKPSEEIENYVYKTWLPYANKKLRKIAA